MVGKVVEVGSEVKKFGAGNIVGFGCIVRSCGNVCVVKPTKNNIAAKWCSLTMPFTVTEALHKEASHLPW